MRIKEIAVDVGRLGSELFTRPLRIYRRLDGSREVATAMIDFMMSNIRADGESPDDPILGRMMKRELRRAVEPALKSVKGQAQRLLNEQRIRPALQGTHHLGALESLSALKASRLDYVALTADLLLQTKQRFPGLGLSSPVAAWQNAERSSALELTQSWAILHSWGHLFGTFATERGLIFALERDADLESEIKGGCRPELRSHVERVLGSRDLHRVYYALAAWRASTQLTGQSMALACSALRLFFEHREQTEPSLLYTAYHRARQLAYHRIHSYLRLGPTCDFAHSSSAVEWILPQPELLFDQTVKAPFVELLNKFDAFQSQQVFTSPVAARLVLDHVRSFKRWWSDRRSQVSAATALSELFQRPASWSDGGLRPLEHWCRVTVPVPAGRWTAEVRGWLDASAWEEGNFLVSPLPAGGGVSVDVYGSPSTDIDGRDAELLWVSGKRLAQHCESALGNPPTEPEELWRSVGVLALKAFSWLLAAGFSASLTPARASCPEARYALLAETPLKLADELGRLVPQLSDESRKREVSAVRNAIVALLGDGLWLAVLGTIRVLRQGSGEHAKELDGVIARIDESGVSWWFLEHKSGSQNGASTQLAALGEMLRLRCSPVESVQVMEGRAVWCSCVWP